MAVYTQVSASDLEQFLSSYDIGTLVSHEGIKQGVSNTNYFVTTTAGRYVLTLFEPHRVLEEDIAPFMDFTICLEENGVPCPRTLPRKDGSFRAELCGRPAAIFSVLDGKGLSVEDIDADKCQKAGELLAQMHLAVRGFAGAPSNRFSLNRWQHWLGILGSDMNKVSDGLFALATDEYDYVASHWPRALPSGAIHADYFPDNVFFEGADVTGIIDFHFVCDDFFAYDLAIALNAWSFDINNQFNQGFFDAFLRGYNSLRPLTKEEKIDLPVLLRAAALRFLLSRVEEKLNWKPDDFMKPHDPIVFEQRLRHFQSIESIAA